MTFDEVHALGKMPVALSDGKMGSILVYNQQGEIGVQLPGDEEIRWLMPEELVNMGDGALIQVVGASHVSKAE